MSYDNDYRTRPPLVTGPDGLLHCGRCGSEHELCVWHKAQVRHVLDNLKTPNMLARSERDIRYVIHHKDTYAEADA